MTKEVHGFQSAPVTGDLVTTLWTPWPEELRLASPTELQPTVFHAAWRHRLLVAISAIVGLALGIGASALSSSPGFVATASVILQDPSSTTPGSAGRFLVTQAEVMTSILVAEEAAKLLAEQEPSLDISMTDIVENTEVTGGDSSDLVLITHESETAEGAQAGVNALIQAYEDINQAGATSTAQAALERIDDQLNGIDARLDAVRTEIEALEAEDTLAATLASQAEAALARIAGLQAQLPAATEDERTVIQSELADLRAQLDLYGLINSIRQLPPELVAAEEEESQLTGRRAELLSRRDDMAIEIDSIPSPILLAVPASEAAPIPTPGVARFAIGGLILGALAGSGIAYWRLVRRRVFTSRSEPEMTLGVPLIADIPDFASEGIDSQLPVRDDPRSVAAEAYQFAAASVALKASSSAVRSIMAVSAVVGNGKTTTVANTALALAREGHRVLAIDADLGNQELARLLAGIDAPFHPGLSEVLAEGLPVELAVQEVQLDKKAHLSLMTRGRGPVTAADLLRQSTAQEFFMSIREHYDLVLVDTPPLLQVAYASTLLGYVDAGLVIVGHGSPVGELEEVANRMAFFGRSAIGYLYNKAPARRDLPRSGGSLVDILGTQLASPDQSTREERRRHMKR